jgi:hypothetical protein
MGQHVAIRCGGAGMARPSRRSVHAWAAKDPALADYMRDAMIAYADARLR